MRENTEYRQLEQLFTGLVEHPFFVQVGLCDPKVTDYLIRLLIEFVHVDKLYRLRGEGGKRLNAMLSMLGALERGELEAGMAERDVHRYIGDFALFWSGVYPEGLRRHAGGINPDHLVDYVGRGKEAYAIASSLFDEESNPPSSVLKSLSREFEVCAHGLGLVRRSWEGHDLAGPGADSNLLY